MGVPIQTKEATGPTEKLKGVETMKLTEALEHDLQKGIERVISQVATPTEGGEYKLREDAPDMIVTLHRTGPLAFKAVEAYAEEHQVELPPVVAIGVGRELTARFQTYIADKMETEGVDVYADGGFELTDYLSEFDEWLRQDKTVQEQIALLVQRFPEGCERVLLVDDTTFEGATLGTVAPTIVRMALEAAEVSGVTIDTEVVFRDDSWIEHMLGESLGSSMDSPTRFFLGTLVRSSLKDSLGRRVAIASKQQLALLGKQIEERTGSDPYPPLSRKYGDGFLLDLHSQTVKVLQKTAVK